MITEKPDASLKAEIQVASEAADKQIVTQTAGQMEREVSQKIQALYKRVLGHQLGRVTCQLFDSRIAIILEDSISQPVKLLLEDAQIELAQRIRTDLDSAMQPQIKALLASILGVEVLDVLSDATLSTGRTGIIGVLSCPPSVRNSETISKDRKLK
ncbi:MAG: DUF2294 domain-containing protein [Phormidesmis sp.]